VGTAALAVAAHIRVAVPFSPVPITLQTLVVIMLGFVSGRRALAAIMLYLVLGACGLPVFAGGVGGGALVGPTGGYLIGFIPGAAAAAWGYRRGVVVRTVAGAAGLALIYGCGLVHLAYVWRMGWAAAWTAGAVPFLAGDIAKLAIAVVGAGGLRKLRGIWLSYLGGGAL